MERRFLEPHEVLSVTMKDIFKPFFERMDAFEQKTKAVAETAEKGEENNADFLRKS